MVPILFLEVDREDESLVREHFPEAIIIGKSLEGDELVKTCKDAEIISTFIYSKFPREVIKKLPKLKLLCTRSVGYNHIDLEVCKERGIMVSNVPDYGSYVIAEFVFALLLSKIRHIPEADKRVESGEFDYHGLRGMALYGDTIGIVGTGKIGAHVALIAHGFGMRILAFDKCRKKELEAIGVKYSSFEELLEQSDFVSLHVPATDETYHMIDDIALHRMKKDVVLINTARGEVIDAKALLAALKGKKVKYALLDVLEDERKISEHPELKALVEHPNVIVTPHIAFYADDSMRNMYADCFESIEQWQRGEEPIHVVKPMTKVCDMSGYKGNKKKS